MAQITETRLWSKTQANVQPVISKKRTKKKRRRKASGCAEDDSGEREDALADAYVAAQSQMKQEMKAAGLEGSLPMCFGTTKTLKKRKRPLEEVGEQVLAHAMAGPVEKEEKEIVTDRKKAENGKEVTAREEEEQRNGDESLILEMTSVDKVHIVYNSECEIAERVVAKVEVKSEEQSVQRLAYKNSRAGKKKKKYPVPTDVVKFYVQRHILFEKFGDGIQLDHESWYSVRIVFAVPVTKIEVTPQVVAEHIATRLSCDVVVDPFAGCGGNVIQLAMTCKQVIAIDIDPEKIRMAKHNAAIYGVAEKIEWIVGNSIDILPRLKADVVFLSPPWGGVTYNRKLFKLEDMLVKGVSGLDLFAKARKVSKNIAYYLPKGTFTSDLEALTPDEPVECEMIYLNNHLKVLTAYYGDLVAPKPQIEMNSSPIEGTGDA